MRPTWLQARAESVDKDHAPQWGNEPPTSGQHGQRETSELTYRGKLAYEGKTTYMGQDTDAGTNSTARKDTDVRGETTRYATRAM